MLMSFQAIKIITVMEFLDLVKKRRSYRKFKPVQVEQDKIEKLLEASFWAPSPLNSQPWKFYVATGKARDELVEIIKKYPIYVADLIESYPQLADSEKQKWIQAFAENLGGAPVVIVMTMPKTTNNTVRKNQLIACGAAIQNFYLAAETLGLGTVCLTSAAFVENEILSYLGATDEEMVTVLPLGYPDETPQKLPRKQKVIYL